MRLTSFFVFGIFLCAAPAARADERSSVDAEMLFREGRRAADMGNFALACEKFEASHRAQPAAGTLLNLADCEETRGLLTRAWHDFLALADSLPETDERKAVALERARTLERSMPRLRVRLARTSFDARVFRDGIELGDVTLGVALPVDPGYHLVTVREPGFHERSYTIDVKRGEERDLQVEHGVTARGADPKRLIGWTLGGFGVASLAAGAITGVLALTSLSASNAQCPNGTCTDPKGVAQHAQARDFAIASDVLLGVGAALVVTSIVVLVASRGKTIVPTALVARF
ncbi:MAG TPA: hypothetical protein VH054_01005 [Polyangiaceae bacterium]|jgi:hypothetical protein|nr:hypothetical protein [Polyangiaceae bacterium]